MKLFRRCLSVFLCFLVLSIGFSSIVTAENIDLPEYSVRSWCNIDSSYHSDYDITFSPFDDTETYHHFNGIYMQNYNNTIVFSGDGDYLVPKGDKTTVYINDIQCRLYRENAQVYKNEPDTIRILLQFDDGSNIYVDDFNIKDVSNLFSLEFTLSPKKNITDIEVIMSHNLSAFEKCSFYLGETIGAKYNLIVDQKSEEVGLLESISNWLSGIFDSIVELPSKIWEFIENGLKALFVPDSEYISGYKDKWDSLLSSRFGVVYESGQIIADFINNILGLVGSDTDSFITMPLVSLDGVGIPYEFGGFDVQIVPEGFGFIAECCKIMSVILALLMFLNGMRKRYDEIMGVEQ